MTNSKEWIPMKEALDLSGMKSGTFTYYVAQGKVRRQEGEKQRDHKYNRADILKLVKDRTPRQYPAQRGTRPNKPVVFDWIRPGDIGAVLQLDYEVYREEYLAEAERYKSWRVKNPELSMAAFDARDRKVCLGYVGLLPLPEETILRIMRGQMDEKDITGEDILTFEQPGGYSMLANSAVIHPDRPDLLFKILYRITRAWIDRYPERYMRKIYAQSVSQQGDRVVQNFFMQPRYDLAYNAYELDLARPPRARLLAEFKRELERIAPLPEDLRWPPSRPVAPARPPMPAAPIIASASAPRQKPATQADTLPEEYKGFTDMFKDHGISESTARRGMHTKFEVIEGRWYARGRLVSQALDAGQQRAFIQAYRSNSSFHVCADPACPCHEM